jgi:hypothetical protein
MTPDKLERCVRCGWVQGVNGEVCACLDETGERAVEEYVRADRWGKGPGGDLFVAIAQFCRRCLDGEGGECHTPGCALWLNRAPDVPMWGNVTINEAMTPSEDESHSGRSDA